jgi:hypothetical protein
VASNRQLPVLTLACVCMLLASCRDQPLSYSSPPGAVDQRPDTFWGRPYPHIPPEVDGRPFDPTRGLGVQKFADRLIGARIATFVGHRWAPLHAGPIVNDFLTPAELGPGPGTCRAHRFEIMSDYSKVKASDGKWSGSAYAVAGSVAPMPEPWGVDYKARLLQACRNRSDMDMWYWAEPRQAYLAARLADAIIATARQPGEMPFDLRCTPYAAPRFGQKPQCAADVRKSVASINSRAIISVDDCLKENALSCLKIQFPKETERLTKIVDRWTFNVHFEDRGNQIRKVEVQDTQLIID